MNTPKFSTAIPVRRYQIGEFSGVVLSEVEAEDGNQYIYLFALVKDGQTEPSHYVSLEKTQPGEQDAYKIRVVTPDSDQVIGYSPQALDVDEFTHGALSTCAAVANLADEEPMRVL